jgi:hypothetical protein
MEKTTSEESATANGELAERAAASTPKEGKLEAADGHGACGAEWTEEELSTEQPATSPEEEFALPAAAAAATAAEEEEAQQQQQRQQQWQAGAGPMPMYPVWPAPLVPLVLMGHDGGQGCGAWWQPVVMAAPVAPAEPWTKPAPPVATGEPAKSSKEGLQGQPLERIFSVQTGSFRVCWHVDARKLRGDDLQLVSPSFELALSSRFPNATFKLMVLLKVVKFSKGGRCFRKSQGKGYISLKCETDLNEGVPLVSFNLLVGKEGGAPLAPKTHDFSKGAVFEAPEVWDFGAAVDPQTATCCVGVEVLPSRSSAIPDPTGAQHDIFPNLDAAGSIRSLGKLAAMLGTPEEVKASLPEVFEPREQESWDLDSQSTSADSHDGSAHHIKCDLSSKDLGSASSTFLTDLGQSSTEGSTQSSPQSLSRTVHQDVGHMTRPCGRKRRPSKNPKGQRSPCSFFLKGCCRFGEKCRDAHVLPSSGPEKKPERSTAPKLRPDACRVCGKVTDPPHWGNECPEKDKVTGKSGSESAFVAIGNVPTCSFASRAEGVGAPLVVQAPIAGDGGLSHGGMQEQETDLEASLRTPTAR